MHATQVKANTKLHSPPFAFSFSVLSRTSLCKGTYNLWIEFLDGRLRTQVWCSVPVCLPWSIKKTSSPFFRWDSLISGHKNYMNIMFSSISLIIWLKCFWINQVLVSFYLNRQLGCQGCQTLNMHPWLNHLETLAAALPQTGSGWVGVCWNLGFHHLVPVKEQGGQWHRQVFLLENIWVKWADASSHKTRCYVAGCCCPWQRCGH